MRTTLLAPTLALLFPLMTVSAHAADWRPEKGPLMTRWAKDVTPAF